MTESGRRTRDDLRQDVALVRQAVENSVATAVSADRSVTVTVGPGAAVTAVEFTPHIARHTGQHLGSLIVETAALAAQRARELLAEAEVPSAMSLPEVAATLSGSMPPLVPPPSETTRSEPSPLPEGTPPDVVQALTRMSERSRRLAADYARIRPEMESLTETASSPDGSVTVVVRYGRPVEEVTIQDEATRRGPSRMSRLVMTALRLANLGLATRMAETVHPLLGTRVDLRSLVASARAEPNQER